MIGGRAGDGGKSFFSFSSLFTLTTIIEILLSRSAHVSKTKLKQNIKFSFSQCMYVHVTFVLFLFCYHCQYVRLPLYHRHHHLPTFFLFIITWVWYEVSMMMIIIIQSFSSSNSYWKKRNIYKSNLFVTFSASLCCWLFDNNNINYN